MLVSVGVFVSNGRLSVSLSRLSEMYIIVDWFGTDYYRLDIGQSNCYFTNENNFSWHLSN